MNDERRERVRERIETAKARLESTGAATRDAAATARRLVEQHPFAALAGGLLIGALVARMIPARKRSALADKARKAVVAAGEIAVSYASRAAGSTAEARREGVERLSGISESVSGRVSDGSTEVRRLAAEFGDAAAAVAREASEAAIRRLGELAGKMRK